MNKKVLAAAMAMAAIVPTAALAQTVGTVTTDLNLREGPGGNYKIIETIPAGGAVTVDGCVVDASWCQVTVAGTTGFVAAQYLTITNAGETVVVHKNRGLVPEIAAETIDAVGNTVGAVTGALIGGTVGVVSGGAGGLAKGLKDGAIIGGTTFHVSEPEIVYVRDNPVQPVYLDGEVVVGVGIPDTVTLYEISDSQYEYAYINSTAVIVEPASRKVIYVVG